MSPTEKQLCEATSFMRESAANIRRVVALNRLWDADKFNLANEADCLCIEADRLDATIMQLAADQVMEAKS